MHYNISKGDDGVTRVSTALRPGGTRNPRMSASSLTGVTALDSANGHTHFIPGACVCYDRDGNVIRVIAPARKARKATTRDRTTGGMTAKQRRDFILSEYNANRHASIGQAPTLITD